MKIAMVSDYASPIAAPGGPDAGGQNVHVAALSAALVRHGHEVVVFTRRESESVPERLRAPEGYDVIHVSAGPVETIPKDDLLPHLRQFAHRVRDYFSHSEFDVVHSHFWTSGLTAGLAGRTCHLPIVHTFHALGIVQKRYEGAGDTSPPERIPLECKVGRSVDAVVATSSDEVFELVRMGIPRSRIAVVPCGVDVDEFRPDGPRTRRSNRSRLTSVGRLVPRKGFDVAIRALAKLANTELVIAGGPTDGAVREDAEARRLSDLAARLGVAERLAMPGRVPRNLMPRLLRSTDVVVCSPWYEPFGIVPLEAMACSKPVVASAVGGLADTVVDGITGIHVPPRNSDALAHAVHTLLREPLRREQYGYAGRDRAVQRYAWDRIADETERIYRTVSGQLLPHSTGGVGR
ncbi:glycosyltransferase [Prescottella soli]|uniref:Glycosyltransferase n=1 Tax=Prescottella soli TaxID=1543852 RepID=A0ABW9G247_9NOCA